MKKIYALLAAALMSASVIYAAPAAAVQHHYTIKLYAPAGACPDTDMKPAIIGNFNNWTESVAMNEELDDDLNTFYTYTFEDIEGNTFCIKEASDTDWSNLVQYYDEANDEWVYIGDHWLGADTIITLDYSNNDLYRWAKACYCSIATNTVNGSISPQRANYKSNVTLIATPNYGYHFVQWSDGVTDNPRTFVITQDTTFTAEFEMDTTGTCGKDLALTWEYDRTTKTLTISGNGEFTGDKRCGVEAKSNMRHLIIGDGVTIIGSEAFWKCGNLLSMTIPNSVTRIEGGAFNSCSSLTSVTIPNSVTEIEWDTFYGCRSLTSVTIGNSVTSIGEMAFYGCTSLRSIEIPNSVTSIENRAFYNCSSLTSLSLGANITSYEYQVFYGCSALTTIYNYRERPAKLGSEAFYGVDYFNCTLYVPDGSVDMYKSSGSDWKDFYFIESMASTGDEYTVTYIDKDEELIDSENIKLHLPEAPEIEGFSFLGWRPVATFIESNTIVIEAVYESEGGTDLPAEVSVPANPAQKLIRQGNIYVLTSDKTYTLSGQAVK